MLNLNKVLWLVFALIYMSGSVVFAGEQEKAILKQLEKVSSFSEGPDTSEFLQALSDCQAEIKMAKIAGSNYPEFMQLAEQTFLLFKAEKELADEMRVSMFHASGYEEKLRIKADYLHRIIAKQKTGQRRLDELYGVYKDEVLKK